MKGIYVKQAEELRDHIDAEILSDVSALMDTHDIPKRGRWAYHNGVWQYLGFSFHKTDLPPKGQSKHLSARKQRHRRKS